MSGDDVREMADVQADVNVILDCDRCYGEGEVEDDVFVFTRCYSCWGRGTIEVCAACLDNGEECDVCGM